MRARLRRQHGCPARPQHPGAAAKTRSGIDFALAPAATVTGRVVDASTGAAIGGTQVVVWTLVGSTRTVYGAVADGAGDYTVTGLAAGTYYAYTDNGGGYVDELFGDLPCLIDCEQSSQTSPDTPLAVASGATVSGRNFALATGGTIAGQADAATGAPLKNIDVIVFPRGGQSDLNAAYGSTDAAGLCVVRGLQTGAYVAFAQRGLTNDTGEVFDNVLCTGGCSGPCTRQAGQTIAVTAGHTTGGVNFALTAAGAIAGTVTSSVTSLPLEGLLVKAFRRVCVELAVERNQADGTKSAPTEEPSRGRSCSPRNDEESGRHGDNRSKQHSDTW